MIDCDQLLYGDCTMDEVREFFRNASFDSEQYAVAAIKRHLCHSLHKQFMEAFDFTIEDMLNGRVQGNDARIRRDMIFASWNKQLGFHYFG